MKKTIIAVALIAGSSWLAAASLTTGGKTALQNGQCSMIATGETANVQLSKDVTGAYDCSSGNSAGVATHHPQGKIMTYSVSSNGGKLVETPGSDIATAATTAMNAS